MKKQFTLYINNKGEKVLVRDVMNKVCGWIEKFKEVGDIAFQFDPSHATIPWIAVKAILQVRISYTEMRAIKIRMLTVMMIDDY